METEWYIIGGEYYNIGRNLAHTTSWHPYIRSEIFTWFNLWTPSSSDPDYSTLSKQFTSTIWDVWCIKNREVESNWQKPRVLVSTLLCSIWESFAFTGEHHLDALGPLIKSTIWAAMGNQQQFWSSDLVPAAELRELNFSLGTMIFTAAEKSRSIPLPSQRRKDDEGPERLETLLRDLAETVRAYEPREDDDDHWTQVWQQFRVRLTLWNIHNNFEMCSL
ncbi:hypothetical protein FB45DRAFT_447957 [Roridomyces roridus]|uniref:Uncharacterized protein n=1 Tax=Roridomyces roridus TaxID=1738132 RepID=A0AAD7C1S8_9AGAR|nr:hypothetical protein FB45DRAFT_447957 [Roridomyces roridus]